MYFDAKVDGMYYNTFISIQYIIPWAPITRVIDIITVVKGFENCHQIAPECIYKATWFVFLLVTVYQ